MRSVVGRHVAIPARSGNGGRSIKGRNVSSSRKVSGLPPQLIGDDRRLQRMLDTTVTRHPRRWTDSTSRLEVAIAGEQEYVIDIPW